jgi:hypothetical protein
VVAGLWPVDEMVVVTLSSATRSAMVPGFVSIQKNLTTEELKLISAILLNYMRQVCLHTSLLNTMVAAGQP